RCTSRTAGEQAALSTTHRAISPNHEDRFFIRHVGRSASPLQVPGCALARFKGDRGLVVHRAIYRHEIRSFGDEKHVAGANLNVCWGIRPLLDVRRNMDHLSARGGGFWRLFYVSPHCINAASLETGSSIVDFRLVPSCCISRIRSARLFSSSSLTCARSRMAPYE